MFQNYLSIAFRSLIKNKSYAAINMVGLATSMAVSLLIGAYVWHETHYDHFHRNAGLIYRVITRVKASGSEDGIGKTGIEIGPLLKQTYPDVREMVRLKPVPATVRNGRELVAEKEFFQADPAVFTVFSYPMLAGDASALTRPNCIVLTQSVARNYFRSANPLGKTMQVNGEPYVVTGILADVPSNADLSFTALLSWRTNPAEQADWLDMNCYTYLLFGNDQQAAGFGRKLTQFAHTYFDTKINALGAFDFAVKNELQPLVGLHFAEMLNGDNPKGNRTALMVLGCIAVLLLLVACINYVNLYIAQSIHRQKEAGVRKVLGAGKGQLARQFMVESALMMVLSAGLAFGLAQALTPAFRRFTEKAGVALTGWGWPLAVGVIGILLVVGLLTSSYPAFYLARFNPTQVIKQTSVRLNKSVLGQGLVVAQFSIAIALMAGTLLMQKQVTYLRTANPGFNREQLLVVQVPDEDGIRRKMPTLRRTLAADSRIEAVTTGQSPVNMSFKASFVKETPEGQKINLFINTLLIDEAYLSALKLNLVAGKNFTGPADREHHVLVNEAFVKWMGWTEAVGRKINPSANDSLTARVIGVVRDFHYQSLHHAIEPVLMYYGGDSPIALLVRVKPTHIDVVRRAWNVLVPDRPFTYTFLNDSYGQQYRQEEKLTTLIGWLSALTIFVACLGLFGLAHFLAQQRTKEIGVRKVLGASVASLVALLSKDFLKLVLMAIGIATPLAWYFVRQWLANFAYRISIDGWLFVLAGASALIITLLTISFQSIKAALVNPVKSLRSE